MPQISTLLAQPAPERFDGAEAWAKLDPETQARIGISALELVCALNLSERVEEDELPERYERIAFAAYAEMERDLNAEIVDALPREAFEASDGRLPSIPSALGAVCRACGCSQNFACDGGCGWAADDLCTACIEGGEHDHG